MEARLKKSEFRVNTFEPTHTIKTLTKNQLGYIILVKMISLIYLGRMTKGDTF